eukprot:SAG11_NODE_784_length_7187_cov_2.920429_4_plen_332_part_00
MEADELAKKGAKKKAEKSIVRHSCGTHSSFVKDDIRFDMHAVCSCCKMSELWCVLVRPNSRRTSKNASKRQRKLKQPLFRCRRRQRLRQWRLLRSWKSACSLSKSRGKKMRNGAAVQCTSAAIDSDFAARLSQIAFVHLTGSARDEKEKAERLAAERAAEEKRILKQAEEERARELQEAAERELRKQQMADLDARRAELSSLLPVCECLDSMNLPCYPLPLVTNHGNWNCALVGVRPGAARFNSGDRADAIRDQNRIFAQGRHQQQGLPTGGSLVEPQLSHLSPCAPSVHTRSHTSNFGRFDQNRYGRRAEIFCAVAASGRNCWSIRADMV